MKRISAAAVLLISTLLTAPAHTADEGKGRLEGDGKGLQTATFDTISGTVTVHLPEEMAAGDTISGTIVAEPAGNTDRKRDKNLGTLSGYVLEVEDRREEVGDGRITMTLPRAAGSTDVVTLVLRESRKGKPGREVGRVDLPLHDVTEATEDFRLPHVAQTGHPLVVHGRFDGDLATTGLRVGEADALPLAESPRAAIFRSPAEIVGKAPLTLSEQGETVAEGEIRNVAVNLSAPNLDLKKGESTTLSAVVSGLEDLEEEIPLTLRVWPAAVVNVEGGHSQDLVIRPEDVDATGSYDLSLRVTGRTTGGWTAEATVETPAPAEHFVLVLEGDPMGRVRKVSGGTPGNERIRFEADLDLKRPFYDWIQSSFEKGHVRKSGEIVAVDRAGAERDVREFHQAFIDSVAFPGLDSADKSPAYMTLTIDPERVRHKKGSGKKIGGVLPATKKWLCSNFRVEIGDLPVAPVSKIDSFTWERGLDQKLTISTSDLGSWEGWHRAFVGPQRAGGGALDGRLVFLGPDPGKELATIEFHDASMASLEVGAPAGDTRRITVELVNSRLSWVH